MKRHWSLLLVFSIALLLCLTKIAKAQDGDTLNRVKHLSVAYLISGGISFACRYNIRLIDGSTPQWGCFLMGAIPTVIGAAAFEGAQNDLSDAEGDMLMALIGALAGGITSAYILPKTWFDHQGVDITIHSPTKFGLSYNF